MSTKADTLSRRERQIMNVLHRLRRATAAEVQAALPAAPSYSTVRALLRILEAKKHVRHEPDGARYIYEPVSPRATEAKSALRQLVDTFFDGSTQDAVAALLDLDRSLDRKQLDDITRRIAAARKEGR
jgi:BlaI family transcriptional regulator, penicillinase repressor